MKSDLTKYLYLFLLFALQGVILSAQNNVSKPENQNNMLMNNKKGSVKDTILLTPDANKNSSATMLFAPANNYDSKASRQEKKMTDSATINTPFLKISETRTQDRHNDKNPK